MLNGGRPKINFPHNEVSQKRNVFGLSLPLFLIYDQDFLSSSSISVSKAAIFHKLHLAEYFDLWIFPIPPSISKLTGESAGQHTRY